MSFVRTVLGDIQPHEMGLTYSHEHIVIEESFPTIANPDFILNNIDLISAELKEFYQHGGRTLVDTMPANCGRNVIKLAAVSRNSNVNIIAPTGIHLEIYYPPNHWRYHLSADELTSLFIKDITEGIDEYDYGCPIIKRTSHKAGLIKLATGMKKSQHTSKKFLKRLCMRTLKQGRQYLLIPTVESMQLHRQSYFQSLVLISITSSYRMWIKTKILVIIKN